MYIIVSIIIKKEAPAIASPKREREEKKYIGFREIL